MSFVGEIAETFGKRTAFPALDAWCHRFQARPAYRAAIAKGGAYSYAS